MAKPIDFTPPPRDPRESLRHQLRNAPDDHVEALLDTYAILQLLRDKGLLELAKGLLGSGEKVLAIVTETMERDEVVRTVRNLVIFIKILGALDPEVLEKIVNALAHSAKETKTKKPPGIMRLLGELTRPEVRRALTPLIAAMQSAGHNLKTAQPPAKEGKRKKTTRHSA